MPGEVKCTRCHYTWKPRIARPKNCPHCKSPKWNMPYQRKVTQTAKKFVNHSA